MATALLTLSSSANAVNAAKAKPFTYTQASKYVKQAYDVDALTNSKYNKKSGNTTRVVVRIGTTNSYGYYNVKRVGKSAHISNGLLIVKGNSYTLAKVMNNPKVVKAD
ncbi:hypothetical protein [Lactobacillus sp. Sy-1]|uniref:hypothetical protein n=1 Tax=Lactobacillus sp. Sy-1 TaxID=2109645 RepID=UPI001C5BBAE4|nr:hypothetical protein [Lactobacillus sp. Sy-1]MBW1606384.1 hypothetical protein [Lactobacillus sp. Sy-1]